MSSSKLKNCEDEHNALLCAFLEFFWDENDREFPGCRNIDLISWMRFQNLNICDEHWYFSSKLDSRVSNKYEFTDISMEADVDHLRQIPENNRLSAKLVFALRKILPILIACDKDINYTNENGQTFLHLFIEGYFNDKDELSKDQTIRLERLFKQLLCLGMSFYVNDKNEKTAIDLACFKSYDLLNIIVSNLTDVETRDQNGNTLLHILVNNSVDEEGNIDKAKRCLVMKEVSKSAKNVNAKNNEGVTPTHICAGKFNYDILKILVDSGADLNIKTKFGQIPLHYACKSTLKLQDSSKAVSVVDFLASFGNLEAVDIDGYAPLHYGSEFASVDVVRKLIERGAFVDSRTNPLLLTPLYLSAITDRLDIMEVLIAAGSNINAEALDGTTPISMSAMLGSYESFNYLINKGADLHRRDNVLGFTLMHMAANAWDFNPQIDNSTNISEVQSGENQYLTKLEAIIDKGFDVNDPAKCGISPIQLATNRYNLKNVNILIQRGANVNFQGHGSQITALHLGAIACDCEILETLTDNASDLNCRAGVEKLTPLHMTLMNEIQWQLGKYSAGGETRKETSCIRKNWPKSNKAFPYASERLVSILLQKGALVNVKDALGRTSLHFGALLPTNGAMEKLLRNGALVNVQNKEKKTPLHYVLEGNDAGGLELLLDFGGDINEDDISDMIVNSEDEIKYIALEHIIKRHLVHLNVAKVYEPFIHSSEFADFREQCLEELERLVSHREAGVSLRDFLQMPAMRQQLYATKILERCSDLQKIFPLYNCLIYGSCCESLNRKKLLDRARLLWTAITKVSLPEFCINHILDYLSNRFLEVFAFSGSYEEKMFIETKTNFISGSAKSRW